MSDDNTGTTTGTDTTTTDTTVTDTETVESLIKDRDKWKGLSRKHEDSWKTSSKELDTLRAAQMTDSEKAIEAAKAEGRSSALSELGSQLATARLETAAATAGVKLPEGLTAMLNTSSLIGADGLPNTEAINALVGSFGPATQTPVFSQNIGVGPQSSTGAPAKITREALLTMTPAAIVKAKNEGLLNHLMHGE